MKKIAVTLSAATLLMSALVGCGADQQTRGFGTNNQRGFGIHTTQDQRGATGHRVGEGPITDMFTRDDRAGQTGFGRTDRHPATGLAGQRGMAGRNAGAPVPQGMPTRHRGMTGQNGGVTGQQGMTGQNAGTPGGNISRFHGRVTGNQFQGFGGANRDMGMNGGQRQQSGFIGDAREGITRGQSGMIRSTRDADRYPNESHYPNAIRGQRNTTTGQGNTVTGQRDNTRGNHSYPEGYDYQTVNRLNTHLGTLSNGRDSRVLVHDDTIIVGVQADRAQADKIRNDIKGMAGNRDVMVVTEREQIDRVRSLDDRLRGGEALDEVGATFTEMVRDFGRALGRPFERTRR